MPLEYKLKCLQHWNLCFFISTSTVVRSIVSVSIRNQSSQGPSIMFSGNQLYDIQSRPALKSYFESLTRENSAKQNPLGVGAIPSWALTAKHFAKTFF